MDIYKTPLVSIIISTFNRSKMLERLIFSVDQSTFKDVEIIVINDCSTDNTKLVLESIKTKISPKLVVINNIENKNITYCRNIGLETAKGKYLFLIDDDKKFLGVSMTRAVEDLLTIEFWNGVFSSVDIISGASVDM